MKSKLKTALNSIIFLFILGLLYLGISHFYIGLHNADLAFNMLSISDQLKSYKIDIGNIFEIHDKSLKGEEISLQILFTRGLKQMRNGFIALFISALFLGYYFHEFKTTQKEEKWKKRRR